MVFICASLRLLMLACIRLPITTRQCAIRVTVDSLYSFSIAATAPAFSGWGVEYHPTSSYSVSPAIQAETPSFDLTRVGFGSSPVFPSAASVPHRLPTNYVK